MPRDGEVDHAQPVPTDAVSARLLEHPCGLEHVLDPVDDLGLLVQLLDVPNSIVDGEVDRLAQPIALPDVIYVPAAWEEVALLVHAEGHHAVVCLEGFFYAVSVVAVDVDLEHTFVNFQHFDDSDHAVVDPAEAGGVPGLGVVEAPGVVDPDFDLVVDDRGRSQECALRVGLDVVPLLGEVGTVLAGVLLQAELGLLLHALVLLLKAVDIVVRVELCNEAEQIFLEEF